MKKLLLLSLLQSVAIYSAENGAQQNQRNDLLGILDNLGNRIYCIAEVSANENNEIEQELKKTEEEVSRYFEEHTEIDNALKKKAFFKAAAVGNEKIIRLFLKNGLTVDERNEKEETPAMMAAYRGNIVTLKELFDQGADSNAKNSEQRSLEHYTLVATNDYLSDNPEERLAAISIMLPARVRFPERNIFWECFELIQAKKKEVKKIGVI